MAAGDSNIHAKNLHIVFTYGTLRRGQKNESVLQNKENGTAELISEAVTVEKWPLVIATKFNIPFLLRKPGHGHNIVGEIYQVDDKMLKHLDWFEDSPKWYKRQHVLVTKRTTSSKHENSTADNSSIPGDQITCWGYVLENFREDLLEYELFSDYLDAVKIHGYEKELEDIDEARLESCMKATIKE